MPEPTKGTAVVPAVDLDRYMIEASTDSFVKIEAYRAAKAVEREQLLGRAAIEIANTQWGGSISVDARKAVARWCMEAGLDPARHIYILGGKIYDNAEYYIDKLASMATFHHAEIKLVAPLDHRKIDPEAVGTEKATELRRMQQEMNAERLCLQMTWGVPPEANDHPDTSAAAVVTLYFTDGSTAQACNWAGSMGKKRPPSQKNPKGAPKDPIGDDSPVKTAITRALRKAAKQKVPLWYDRKEDESLAEVEQILHQGREIEKASGTEWQKSQRHWQPLTEGGAKGILPAAFADGYGSEDPPETVQEPDEDDIREEDAKLAEEEA